MRNTLMTCCQTEAEADALAAGDGHAKKGKGKGAHAGLLPGYLKFNSRRAGVGACV